MTKEERDYIEKQLHNIQSKKTTGDLTRYLTLVPTAALTDEVKGYLYRAGEVRKEELVEKVPPLVVTSEFD